MPVFLILLYKNIGTIVPVFLILLFAASNGSHVVLLDIGSDAPIGAYGPEGIESSWWNSCMNTGRAPWRR